MPETIMPVKTEREDSPVAPDSTTIDKVTFSEGEDVLVFHKDGLYYLGTVVEVDNEKEKCLVLFGDDTQYWSDFQNLNKMAVNLNEEVDAVCTGCKQNQTTSLDEVIFCHVCFRGFHLNCHKPPISAGSLREDINWTCSSCTTEFSAIATEKTMFRTHKSHEKPGSKKTSLAKSFPYELSSLHWDAYHRTNSEQRYCYCGKAGDWYRRMLQCCRCLQWFHELCTKKLDYPLLHGDRFYLFLCSVCNSGRGERLLRLSMAISMTDLVHLVLYNLALETGRQYHHVDKTIVPYLEQKWKILQLPEEIQSLSAEERRSEVLNALWKCKARFVHSKELNKSTGLWALRTRVPPPLPANHSTLIAQFLSIWTDEEKSRNNKRPRKSESTGKLDTSLDESSKRTLRTRTQTSASVSAPATPAETSSDEFPSRLDFSASEEALAVRSNGRLKQVRLSAKDIRVTKDGQVKRRRPVTSKRKVTSCDQAAASLFSSSQLVGYFPSPGASNQGNQGQEGRICIQAKRVLPSGKVQVLIEES